MRIVNFGFSSELVAANTHPTRLAIALISTSLFNFFKGFINSIFCSDTINQFSLIMFFGTPHKSAIKEKATIHPPIHPHSIVVV
nr:hypothetical protein [Microcystis aeruginosa]